MSRTRFFIAMVGRKEDSTGTPTEFVAKSHLYKHAGVAKAQSVRSRRLDVTRGPRYERVADGHVVMIDLVTGVPVEFNAKGKAVGIAAEETPTIESEQAHAERMCLYWGTRARDLHARMLQGET